MTMKEWRERLAAALRVAWALAPDALAVAGAACLVYGAKLIYYPAGWLTGGAACIMAAVLISKGGDDG